MDRTIGKHATIVKSFLTKVCRASALLKNWGCGHQIRLCDGAIKLSTTDSAQTTPSENLLLNHPSVCSVCSSLLYLCKTSSPKERRLRSQICLVELLAFIFRGIMQKKQVPRQKNEKYLQLEFNSIQTVGPHLLNRFNALNIRYKPGEFKDAVCKIQ